VRQPVTLVLSLRLALGTFVYYGLCILTRMRVIKWRCWYLVLRTRQIAQNRRVMWTSRTYNRVMWSGFIIHSGIDYRRDDPWFTLLLRCYHFFWVFERQTMRLFASLQLLGKWSHVDDCRFGGKLPKYHIDKAQVHMSIRVPRMLWWWKFKRCWLQTSSTCKMISFWYSCQHLLKLNYILCTYIIPNCI
jgi:hypothetical protein